MLKKDTVYFQKKIYNRIEALIQSIFDKPDLILNLGEGEDTVCSVCDLSEKICKIIPDYRCKNAIQGNTEINELDKALHRITDGSYGVCIVCKKPIPRKDLEDNLIRLTCKNCSSKSTKKLKKVKRIKSKS